jgi:hypothetical protein
MRTTKAKTNSVAYLFSRGFAVPALFVFLNLSPASVVSQEAHGVKRPFTVRDSIEFSHIVDPAASTTPGTPDEPATPAPIYSPDHRHFLLVTLRGDLITNTLQSTLWMFDYQAVREYASNLSARRPEPRELIVLKAAPNIPVINDVRWVEGSTKIAFLGRKGSPYQRLFLLDVESGLTKVLTPDDLFVTGYDITGDTVAYTTLVLPRHGRFDQDMVPIEQRSVNDLLYPDAPMIQDLTSTQLCQYPSALHLQREGKEISVNFSLDSNPLELYIPTLSLSSDGKHLVTVASVRNVPTEWEQYQPNGEWFRLKAGSVRPKSLLAWGSMERPEQYVIVDLTTGSVSPLVGAPVARDMGHYILTKAWWLKDNRHVIVTNTYLPFSASPKKKAGIETPVVAIVDTTTKQVQSSIALRESKFGDRPHHSVADIRWDSLDHNISIMYKATGDDPVPSPDTYLLTAGSWNLSERTGGVPTHDLQLSVKQDLNNPPTLREDKKGNPNLLIWDPNAQLASIQLGKVFVDHWRDDNGRQWSGIVAIPPDYDPSRHYPLVIQTHGYDPRLFFTDGEYTTGSGGRALAAKGIVVLQMDVSLEHASTTAEGADNLAGMMSAICHLAANDSVDPNLVGVVGFSRTAYHVMFALTHRSDLFAAAVVTNANFSYVPYVLWSSGSAPGELERESEAINGGIPWADDDLAKWHANAPNFGLSKITTPLLITATERGELLPQWETFAGLRRLGKPVDMLWWWRQNTPHILIQPAQRYASQETVVDWFDFWLNHHEDSDVSKRSEYLRWRQLRKSVK